MNDLLDLCGSWSCYNMQSRDAMGRDTGERKEELHFSLLVNPDLVSGGGDQIWWVVTRSGDVVVMGFTIREVSVLFEREREWVRLGWIRNFEWEREKDRNGFGDP